MSSLHRIFTLGKYLAYTAIFLSLSSCYNEPEFIGENLIPPGDLSFVKTDTSFNLSAYSIETDTVITSNFSYGVLGFLSNPIFGTTKADFFTQVYPGKYRTTSTPLFGTTPVADSLILSFYVKSSYGNSGIPLNVKLYELGDSISYYTTYNGLESVDGKYNPTLIKTATFSGDTVLRLKLGNDIAQRLLDVDSATMANYANFRSFFKGFYLSCDDLAASNNAMYLFDFTTNKTNLKLYYHQQDTAHKDTTFMYYPGGYYAARFNHFTHNYSTADPAYKMKYLNDTTHQDTVFYINGLGGIKGMIKLDDISKWAQKMPVAINRAELRVEFENYPGFPPTDSLISKVFYYVKNGSSISNYVYTADQNYISGNQNVTYIKSKKYFSIDLTLHLQDLIRGRNSDDHLFFETTNSSFLPSYAVLRSGAHSKRMKLIITYSNL